MVTPEKCQSNRYTIAPAPADKSLDWKLEFSFPWQHQQKACKDL
jgi:hypothetical protein